jgi:uncharacterized protein with ParB-like and HNH nuclease domain
VEAKDYTISKLLLDDIDIYTVPAYQRGYKWGKQERDELFDDILENDIGYFLGTIICVIAKDEAKKQHWELVDGQQRMISLSLIFAAIYSKLNEFSELEKFKSDDEFKNKKYNLKHELVLQKDENIKRLIPSTQNHNKEDYDAILAKVLLKPDKKVAKNRRIFQAYDHFLKRINEYLDDLGKPEDKVSALFDLLERINKSVVVMIDGGTRHHAYMLFMSLNDRGMELTPVDIIKSLYYASLFESPTSKNPMSNFENEWDKLLESLGEEDTIQERFFRQYYNAFKNTTLDDNALTAITGYSIATRSNLTEIYEKIIKTNSAKSFEDIIEASKLYSFIIGRREDDDEYANLRKPLLDLERIQGTPSYLLLLYLLEKKELKLDEGHLKDIIEYLVRFFVRRNLTDHPATNQLTPLFMRIIEKIVGSYGQDVVDKIKQELVSVSSSNEEFYKYLKEPIYSENPAVTRFVLCALEEDAREKQRILLKETELNQIKKELSFKDLWETKGKYKQYVWTIEHVLPRNKNISDCWIRMIANGNEADAKNIHEKCVDLLGNLTLSGINQELSDKCFKDKRGGYENGLCLNKDLKGCNDWTAKQIEERTKRIANEAIILFALK